MCANTELHQLLRLPILIQHYIKHHEQEPDETFACFLNEHYTSEQNHCDNDHENLPFKTNDCATTHLTVAIVNHAPLSITSQNTFKSKIAPIYNGVIYSADLVSNIWQPPKFS